MLKNISGECRTRRKETSPKIQEVRRTYEELASRSLFRAYPSVPDFGAEVCILDCGDMLELFWSIANLGGEAPGGWHQVHDVRLVFERKSDGRAVTLDLTGHTAGFHAWYRMRGGMTPVLPASFYFNLDAGEWADYVTGGLQDARALCLFADSFGDMYHYGLVRKYYDEARAKTVAAHFAGDTDPAPIEPFRIFAGMLSLSTARTGLIRNKQSNRLHHTPVSWAEVKDVPAPKIQPPPATPLDPVNYFRKQMYYLQEQSVKYNFCPYNTVNYWDHEPVVEREHFGVSERLSYFHIEALAPLYRATGDADVYRSARKWYETLRRNIWPAPGGGTTIACGDRTVFGAALSLGGMCDALCTFTEIDGDPSWLEPFREGLLSWPMHPTLPRPLMDQDVWGNEELNTTGTYNMCTHFALACWRMGHMLGDQRLMAKGEIVLNGYTFPGERNGIWPYRPGNYPSHHYDMYTKWQLSRLLMTGADRWAKDPEFLSRMRRGTDATLREYAHEEDGELRFVDWTHDPKVTHPGNAARQAAAQIEVLVAMTVYVDRAYIEPLTKALRAVYRQLALPEVDRCWHGSWFHLHGNLLSLALHGLHVEGKSVKDMRVVGR